MFENHNQCIVCCAKANQVCSGCREVHYCTKDHQKLHWSTHKKTCPSFKIVTKSKYGRCMIASRNIGQGDVIFREKATVVGPKQGTQPLCLNCYGGVSETSVRCVDCNFPFCTQHCAESTSHADECFILRRAKSRVNIRDFAAIHPVYECVTPLRCLLLKGDRQTEYQSFKELENHNEERRGNDLWIANQTNTVHFLRNVCQLAKEFSEEDIHAACGALDTNAFEIKVNRSVNRIRGVYLLASMMAHHCTPNTNHVIHEKDYEMTVYASRPILKDQLICINYSYSLEATKERRRHLRESKYFDCDCSRCCDSTEGGSYLSALKCQMCFIGNVLPICPLDDASCWSCNHCSNQLKSTVVDKILEGLKGQLDDINPNDVSELEMFLKRNESLLHSNHFVFASARQSLNHLYGKLYLLGNTSEDLLKKKIDVCHQLLQIFDLVEPGLTRIRGVLLFQLHQPMLLMAKKSFDDGQLTANQFQCQIIEAELVLAQSLSILCMEDEDSDEGHMKDAGIVNMEQIADWLSLVPLTQTGKV